MASNTLSPELVKKLKKWLEEAEPYTYEEIIKIPVCFFDEMNLYHHSGSVKKFISSDGVVNYDKDRIISYLSKPLKKAGCPRAGLDCVTGKEISMSFQLFSDEKYTWGDFLIYHIQHYPIILPDDFVQHIMDKTYRSQ